VGDYVYHFSYHRVSLLALLDFFLELTLQDKEVYILAGNHDRLGQHFVYTEAEKILHYNNSSHHIHFITQPCTQDIDNETVLFLPYILNRSAYTPQSESYDFPLSLQHCRESQQTQIQSSYMLNTCLSDMIQKARLSDSNKELIVIHHYYTADTRFPGIKTQFWYKDIALSPHWMEDKNLTIISWHIHHSFSYKNYLCIGAVWSTSPLESNIVQYLFQYNNKKAKAHQVALNPYLSLTTEDSDHIDTNYIQTHRQRLQEQSQQQFESDHYAMSYTYCELPLDRTTITIINNTIGYNTLSDHIEPSLYNTLRETKLKQNLWSMDVIIEDLVNENQNFSSGRSDRKILLDRYLEKKFWDNKQLYIHILKELKIHQ
jgi:DNA repair exonuclease SbcCD nuclease subunit